MIHIPLSDFVWVLIGVFTLGAMSYWMLLEAADDLRRRRAARWDPASDPLLHKMLDQTVTVTCGCGRLSLPHCSPRYSARIAEALSKQCPHCTGSRSPSPCQGEGRGGVAALKEDARDFTAVSAV